jgi:catecholate siderophore receptor
MTNQTNLTIHVATGSVSHAITTGVEFISEEQYSPAYAPASLGALELANPYNPGLTDAPPGYAPARNGVFTRGETQTIGAYVFDTLSFAERWEVTGGFRVDSFDTDFESMALAGTSCGSTARADGRTTGSIRCSRRSR